MIIKITNSCQMNCSHCMSDCVPCDDHMSLDTFKKAMELNKNELKAKFILITGGEPTDNPYFKEIMTEASKYDVYILLLSNGIKLYKYISFLDSIPNLIGIQVTNDERFYPKRISYISNPKITYVDKLTILHKVGRAKKLNPKDYGLKSNTYISCANIRYNILSLESIDSVISTLEKHKKYCCPSIDFNGNILLSEFNFCQKIGDVNSTLNELNQNLISIFDNPCKKCGLKDIK